MLSRVSPGTYVTLLQDHFPLVRAPGTPPQGCVTDTEKKKWKVERRNDNTKRILAVCGPLIADEIVRANAVKHVGEKHATHDEVVDAVCGASPLLKGMRDQLNEYDKDGEHQHSHAPHNRNSVSESSTREPRSLSWIESSGSASPTSFSTSSSRPPTG